MRPERPRQPHADFTPNVFLNRRTNEIPTDGEAIPRIKMPRKPNLKNQIFIRGIAPPSVEIILI